jgi:ATP-dependent Clp protease ATP-binding subunit ClpA
MFERFTSAARETAARAREEAKAGHARQVGTEHLLLALLDERATLAWPVLRDAGVTRERVLTELRRLGGGHATLLTDDDAAALRTIGIDLDAVLARIAETFGDDALTPPPGQTRWFGRSTSSARFFTPHARKSMGLALREAIHANSRQITDGHLLLGLLRGGDGRAVQILANLGVRPDKLRSALTTQGRAA